MKFVRQFRAFPMWARVAAIAAGAVIVVGAISIPVAAVAVDEHNRQLSLERAAAAERQAAAEAAEALADAKGDAARLNAGFDGLTGSLAATVSPDAAATFESARVKLAFAIADGELDEVSAAVTGVTDALEGLAASAQAQAEALITASSLAGASRDALTKAVAELATTDDVTAALTRVKTAADAVVAAQKAGKAAADAAAKERAEAEAEEDASTWDEPADEDPPAYSDPGVEPPGVIGMEPGERGDCGANPTGQVVSMSFSWQARQGNTVDVYYALTDGDYKATSGFTQLVSGAGPSGSTSIPVTCPVGPGPYSFITVKVVASIPGDSATAHYWGL
ncbi:hypothetical protein LQ757_12945 [Agromyces sp. SYSU K20354]|uniref:hypothetical protein n=1 Tax=Agromyces cavernae TaxID=2898659 RepID=UPI001E4C190B|nr:hypothetical protein [Agromyces cavernae]MCD2443183.1 hypothetical protein [Agromyces cavernae]